ncbi:MAG: Spy/CpxP family protein refolding chaperone [Acidobacteriota bacterium]|nr:Spy/CpxP family protein refolding chaperone [Acidobacteriota bacterium]
MKIATRALAGVFAAAVTVAAGSAHGLPASHPQFESTEQSAPKTDAKPAQDRRFKWWKDAQVQKELGLSAAQSDKINTIWETTVPSLRAAHDELEALEAELSRLIRENTADEKIVALQIDHVEAHRSQVNKARSLMLYRMHRVLTANQYQTLTTLMDKWRKDRDKK